MSILLWNTSQTDESSPMKRMPTMLLLIALLPGCNFEFGHAVFRKEQVGIFDTSSGKQSFGFVARGTNTHFTVAADEPIVFEPDTVVSTRVVDPSGAVVSESSLGASQLQESNWDEPRKSVVLETGNRAALSAGTRYVLELAISPPSPAARRLGVVQHWESQRGE